MVGAAEVTRPMSKATPSVVTRIFPPAPWRHPSSFSTIGFLALAGCTALFFRLLLLFLFAILLSLRFSFLTGLLLFNIVARLELSLTTPCAPTAAAARNAVACLFVSRRTPRPRGLANSCIQVSCCSSVKPSSDSLPSEMPYHRQYTVGKWKPSKSESSVSRIVFSQNSSTPPAPSFSSMELSLNCASQKFSTPFRVNFRSATLPASAKSDFAAYSSKCRFRNTSCPADKESTLIFVSPLPLLAISSFGPVGFLSPRVKNRRCKEKINNQIRVDNHLHRLQQETRCLAM